MGKIYISANRNYASLIIERQVLETRKVIADDNAFGKAMSQNKALEARKMSAQGNALGKQLQKKERCKCERPFYFISIYIDERDVSHLQRSI